MILYRLADVSTAVSSPIMLQQAGVPSGERAAHPIARRRVCCRNPRASRGQADRCATLLQGISTAIWLDRINAIKGGAANGGRLSLTQHFDQAVKQAAAAKKPVVVPIVVYDLPSRWPRGVYVSCD
jgi:Glycosyl hydrolases family 6